MPVKIRKDHARVIPKDIAKRALKAAKELEKLPEPSKKEIVALYKEAFEESRRLQKMLKPEWFVKDVDVRAKKQPSARAHLEQSERIHKAILRERPHKKQKK